MLRKFGTIICIILFLGTIPQTSLAELAIRPFLPTGNLSSSDVSWAPYPMDAGEKRIYSDIWSFGGTTDYDKVSYQLSGMEITVGFDYKLDGGYISVAYDQLSSKEESSEWEDSNDGFTRQYYNEQKDIGIEYIHDFDDSFSAGVLVTFNTKERTRNESFGEGWVFASTGKRSHSGTAKLNYFEYALFARFEIDPQLALGILVNPPVNQKTKYDGEFDTKEYVVGHGTHIDVALGYQAEEFAAEIELHNTTDQPETFDGKEFGVSVKGEYLFKENLSFEGEIYKTNEDEVKYEGNTYSKRENNGIMLGVNYLRVKTVFSFDYRYTTLKTDDLDGSYNYVTFSVLYSF